MRMHLIMDVLQLTGPNLGRVFNSRSGCMCSMMPFYYYEAKRPHLKLKTWHKQLLGSLQLALAVPVLIHRDQTLSSVDTCVSRFQICVL